MLIPVQCAECGWDTGCMEDLFLHMRGKLVEKALAARGTAVSQTAVDNGLQIECGEILDALGLHADCCRKTMTTSMQFLDYN
jgi:DNA-directed RNA polymerase subunit N (RpoN/RPB10)